MTGVICPKCHQGYAPTPAAPGCPRCDSVDTMTDLLAAAGVAPPPEDTEARYTEQGLQVFAVGDYEFIAAATQNDAVDFALELWGHKGHDAAQRAAADGSFDPDNVDRCDLDKNKVRECDDQGEPTGECVTFRESLRRRIAKGETFPQFFAGLDG